MSARYVEVCIMNHASGSYIGTTATLVDLGTAAQITPRRIVVDSTTGAIFFSSSDHRIRKLLSSGDSLCAT